MRRAGGITLVPISGMESRKGPRYFRRFVYNLDHRLTLSRDRNEVRTRSRSTPSRFTFRHHRLRFGLPFKMADEEDFSSLPLPDRFTHKVDILGPSHSGGLLTLPLARFGKSERQVTKKPQNSFPIRPAKTTLAFDRS